MKRKKSKKQAAALNFKFSDLFSSDNRIFWLLFSLLVVAYYLFWADFFPNQNGALGHDYRYVMMRLLAGHYWFETNGLWSIPYFTPAYCAGNVFFTGPQNAYFSLPQFLTFVLNPLAAVKWSIFVFSIIGFSGFYLLLKRVFKLSVAISFLGAGLFLLNDYFTYRIIIGHFSFHTFTVLPWVVLLLFWQKDGNLKEHLISSALAAAVFASIFYAGGIHLLIPMFISIIIILIIAKLFGIELGKIYLRLGLFIIIVLLLSAAKLSMALATLSNLPRDLYPLVGAEPLFYAVWLPIKALFFSVPTLEYTKEFIKIYDYHYIRRHEFEMGVSIVPLVLICAGLLFKFSAIKSSLLQHKSLSIVLIALLLVPIFVNYYTPEWNAFLKQIPIIKNSYSLFRWYSIYIPIVILLAALPLNKWQISSKQQWLMVLACLLVALGQKNYVDKSYYYQQVYKSDKIIIANHQAIKAGKASIVPVTYAAEQIQLGGKQGQIIYDEAQIVYGASKISCNEPLFGYRLEVFPQIEKLKVGKVKQLNNGEYNFKNPACYTFPEANNCKAGDHFLASQKQQLDDFLHYKPYQFNLPNYQKALNWLSLSLWFLISILIVWLLGLKIKKALPSFFK